ncbi:orf132 (mitochondrion) [Brassica oleracea]|uniref:ORF132 n=8 Tax=Brassica TaxID=3705 RepID=F8K8T8_BRANA|nr:orf132 [Brassica oleracea]YP_004927771.1 orf132 [Brassica juncea]YP_004927868.1 orf132 [Brassica rapa subsp. oleifera]YP_009907479.1 hypothetical protein [Brassica rapa]AHY20351.1 hypothetical protein [Brassica juncea var. tumida]AIC83260.1 orf132 [Brassica oleracea var. botrytis]AIZ06197.1 hypothetical protein [Brassica napus]AOW69069.1 orf132 [Brassica oleracea var. capitata]AEH43443.1 orf132 [Brassica rapa subsp. oleifera]
MRKTEIPLRRKQHHVKRRWCHSQDHKPSSPSFQRATKTHLLLRLPCPCPCSLPMVSSELLGVSAMVLHHPSNVISSNHALEPVYFWGTPLVLKGISSWTWLVTLSTSLDMWHEDIYPMAFAHDAQGTTSSYH